MRVALAGASRFTAKHPLAPGQELRVSTPPDARPPGLPGAQAVRLWAVRLGDCYEGAVAVPLKKVSALFQSS